MNTAIQVLLLLMALYVSFMGGYVFAWFEIGNKIKKQKKSQLTNDQPPNK